MKSLIPPSVLLGTGDNTNAKFESRPKWWKVVAGTHEEAVAGGEGLNWLDTDVALAFPSNGAYPNFHQFTKIYKDSPEIFINDFFEALDKMSRLGVTETLHKPVACPSDTCAPIVPLSAEEERKVQQNLAVTIDV